MATGRKTGGGSRKGKPNKRTPEVQAIARGFIDDPVYREALKQRLLTGTAGTLEVTLWAYAYGRVPAEKPEDGTFPTSITVTF